MTLETLAHKGSFLTKIIGNFNAKSCNWYWHYKEANTDLIKRTISNFNWEKAFSNTNIKEKVSLTFQQDDLKHSQQLYSA